MAQICGPLQVAPVFQFGEVEISIPADLPEGGQLMLIVGENPIGVPVPSSHIPKGSMVGIFSPQTAAFIRQAIAAGLAEVERQRQAQARNGG